MNNTINELARIIGKHRHDTLELRQAVVNTVDNTTKRANIYIGGGTKLVSATYLSTPTVGATVMVLVQGGDTLILGSVVQP